MKKFVIALFLFAGISMALSAQDFIYLRDGSRIKSSIQRIDGKSILYKEYNNPDSPLYSLKASQVMMIAYENGNVKFFKKEKAIIQRYIFKKNFLTYHLADLIINNFTLSYEHLFKNGTIGLQIPVSFGYGEYYEFDSFKNNFYSGLSLNFYPLGQGKWRYLLGPALRIGQGDYDDEYYDFTTEQYVDQSQKGIFYGKLLINNGVMFTPIESLSVTAVLSLGVRYIPDLNIEDVDKVHTAAAFSFNMSYRF